MDQTATFRCHCVVTIIQLFISFFLRTKDVNEIQNLKIKIECSAAQPKTDCKMFLNKKGKGVILEYFFTIICYEMFLISI